MNMDSIPLLPSVLYRARALSVQAILKTTERNEEHLKRDGAAHFSGEIVVGGAM
jgi:hypothetical protein